MNTRKSTLLLASLALSAWPMAATAQQGTVTTGEVEVGVGAVTSGDFYLNEYTGIEDTDPYFFGNIDIQQRAASDSDSAYYAEILGTDLGLPTESLRIEAGKQGSFSVFGEYDAIPHLRYNDGQTPFSGAGSSNLSLPPGFGRADSPATMTNFDASLKDVEIKTEREQVGAGFSVNLTPAWTLSTSFRSEEKDGIEAVAGIHGTSGGNYRAAILPRPVDFTTQEAELAVGYSGDRLQANIAYNLSVFDNNKNSLTWENPYTTYDAVGATEGRLALEPNNSAHHLSATVGYMVADQTRLTGNLTLGRMIQDDDFLPYTINPSLIVPTALPRASLDGEVNTIRANLGVTTKLSQNIDLKAAYTYDDRDNQTPVDTYRVVPNDSGDQDAVASATWRRNKPYSQQSHKAELEAGYRVTDDTKLSVGYDFEAISRDLSEVEDTQEHSVNAKVRSSLTQTTSASLSYEYATRTGSTYDTTLPFLVSHDDAYKATLTLPDDAYEQNAYLRKYYMADRNSHLLKGGLTWFPNDRLVMGLNGSYKISDYDAVLGLTDSSYGSATIDASYEPSRTVSLSGFFTYDTMEQVQVGWNRLGTVTILPTTPIDAASLWEETVTDQSMVAGVEVGWTAMENALDIVLDYTYARTETEFDFATSIAGVLPLPDLTSTLNSVGIRGDYHATDGVTFRLGYRYEMFEVDDFALAIVDEDLGARLFGLGNGEPDYDAHIIAASMVVKF